MHAAAITFKLRKGICIRLVVDESSFAVGCEYLEKFLTPNWVTTFGCEYHCFVLYFGFGWTLLLES